MDTKTHGDNPSDVTEIIAELRNMSPRGRRMMRLYAYWLLFVQKMSEYKAHFLAFVLLFSGLACTLTAPASALVEVQNSPTPPATATQPAPATRTLPNTPTPGATATEFAAPSCTISTGIESGALNVRSCAGMNCPIIAWLYSGDVATILPTPHPTDWLPIEGGWIYAKFCEVKP